MTQPSGHTTVLLYFPSPPIFSKSPPLRIDSMMGYSVSMVLEQMPNPPALTGQPQVQVYLSPISSPFRQRCSGCLPRRYPVTSISNAYSSSYHFFILRIPPVKENALSRKAQGGLVSPWFHLNFPHGGRSSR